MGGRFSACASGVGVDLAGTVVEDQQVAFDEGFSPVVALPIGALPVEAALSAYSRAGNGDHLYSLETTVDLGSMVARPGDVVRYDGVSAATTIRTGTSAERRFERIRSSSSGVGYVLPDVGEDLGFLDFGGSSEKAGEVFSSSDR